MNGINQVAFNQVASGMAAHLYLMFQAEAPPPPAPPQPAQRPPVETTLSGAQFFAHPSASKASPLDAPSYQAERARTNSIRDRYTQEWKAQVLNKRAEVSANAMTITLRAVMGALMELGPGAIDLTGLQQDRVNGHHLAIVLRATLRRRETTPGWGEALQIAQAALANDGFKAATVLSGLVGR